MTGRRTLIAVALALALAPSVASAQSAADVATARELFREGSQLSQQGKWVEARERYERSLKLKRAPITEYSLGVAQKNTGQIVEALENFRAFLSEPSTVATTPYEGPARAAIIELEKRVARITVAIEPTGAPELSVMIDGQPVPAAALDRPRLVNPGAHEVTARARGYKEARGAATVSEGGTGAVKLTLEPAPEEAPAEPAQAVPIVPVHEDHPAPVVTPTPPGERPNRTLPFVLIGGGAALFAGGAVLGLIGVSQAADAPTNDGPEADAARTKSIVGDVMGGAGIAAAAVGLVVFFTQSPARPAPRVGRPGLAAPWFAGNATGIRVRF